MNNYGPRAEGGEMNDERDAIKDNPMEHGPYTIMIPPEVYTTPPPKVLGWRHPEPVNPRAFGEVMARKKRKGRKA
jgi:hypothetical protein